MEIGIDGVDKGLMSLISILDVQYLSCDFGNYALEYQFVRERVLNGNSGIFCGNLGNREAM